MDCKAGVVSRFAVIRLARQKERMLWHSFIVDPEYLPLARESGPRLGRA